MTRIKERGMSTHSSVRNTESNEKLQWLKETKVEMRTKNTTAKMMLVIIITIPHSMGTCSLYKALIVQYC